MFWFFFVEIPLSKLLAGNVSLEILWQRTLSHIFWQWFLFKKFLVNNFLFSYLLEEVSLQNLVGQELLFWDFRYGFLCREFWVVMFFQKKIGTYFLFKVFVWIMCFFQGLFVRDFFLRIYLQNCFCTKHLSEQKPFRLDACYTRHLLHQTPSAPNTFYTRDVLYSKPFTAAFTRSAFYIRHLVHQAFVTPDRFYTKILSHQTPFTQKHFTPDTFYTKLTKHILHQTPCTPALCHTRHLLHQTIFTPYFFYNRNFLRQRPFTPDTFYTRHVLHQTLFTPYTF